MEVTAQVSAPRPPNPFTDAALIRGTFEAGRGESAVAEWTASAMTRMAASSVSGSCLGPRRVPVFGRVPTGMEPANGDRDVPVRNGGRRGPIRVDREHPWHFIWEGTGEHYFFNGTTAYWLTGWRDEPVIRASLERLHRLKVNRVRVTVAGRTNLYYGEPVMAGPAWTPLISRVANEPRHALPALPGPCRPALWHGLRAWLFDPLAESAERTTSIIPASTTSRFRGLPLAEARAGVAFRPRPRRRSSRWCWT